MFLLYALPKYLFVSQHYFIKNNRRFAEGDQVLHVYSSSRASLTEVALNGMTEGANLRLTSETSCIQKYPGNYANNKTTSLLNSLSRSADGSASGPQTGFIQIGLKYNFGVGEIRNYGLSHQPSPLVWMQKLGRQHYIETKLLDTIKSGQKILVPLRKQSSK